MTPDDTLFTLRYSITQQDVSDFLTASFCRTYFGATNRKVIITKLIVYSLIVLVGIALEIASVVQGAGSLVTHFVFCILIASTLYIVFMFLAVRYGAKTLYAQNKSIHLPLTLTIRESVITEENDWWTIIYPKTTLKRPMQYKTGLACTTTARYVIIIPNRAFSDDAQKAAVFDTLMTQMPFAPYRTIMR